MDYANRQARESALARAIARMTAGQRRKLFAIMGNPPKLENVTAEYWSGHFTAWQSVLTPELEDIFIDSARLMLEDNPAIGIDWDLVNEDAVNWVRQYADGLIRGIDDKTQRGVNAAVADFYDEGLNLGQLRKKLERWYGPMRADTIATTEVTRAGVEGERAVVDEAAKLGFEMVEIWQTANDELVCPICGPRHGMPAGSNWTRADGPPAHPRCKCGVTHEFVQPEPAEPVVAEEAPVVRLPLKPSGVPVSEVMDLSALPGARSKVGGAVRHTLDVIDDVHGDGDLPELPIVQSTRKRSMGGYSWNSQTGEAVKISISRNGPRPNMTTAHEMGHFLQDKGMGLSDEVRVAYSELMGAAKNTQAVSKLDEQLVELGSVPRQVDVGLPGHPHMIELTYDVDKRYIRYLKGDEELFARSYAQYITEKSGDSLMMAELDAVRQLDPSSRAMSRLYPTQWETADFVPVSAAMDNLFEVLGWLTR